MKIRPIVESGFTIQDWILARKGSNAPNYRQ